MPSASSTQSRGATMFKELNPEAFEKMTEALSDISPDLMQFAASFPFGELYTRDGLPKRERQLVTVAALAMRGDAAAQLRVHIDIALSIGIAPQELAEVFLQLAPYGGFPTAINATLILRDAVASRSQAHQSQ